MLNGLLLIGSGVWLLFGEDIFRVPFELVGVEVSSVPDEVLEEFVTVLFLHDDASCLDDIFDVLNQFTTFGTKLVLVDRRMVEDIVQCMVDLGVVG